MTDEKQSSPNSGEEKTEVKIAYHGTSQVETKGEKVEVSLLGNVYHGAVSVSGKVKDPTLLRDAFETLYDVVSSDYSFVPKDRTAYLAFQNMKKQAANLQAWEARQAYFDWLEKNDPLGWTILDPIISVQPDQLTFEVFSKDEGTYATLAVDWSHFDLDEKPKYGTTNIDYSKEFFDNLQQMRSYRETSFSIQSDQVAVETKGDLHESKIVEKKVTVPNSWIRGFLQVQSATTLPHHSFKIVPVDLYNVLRHLRLNADQKKGGRSIRVELVPGEYPRLVLEPWEELITTTGEIYKGRTTEVIRIWGRRRLELLKNLLPIAKEIEVHLLGNGLPSFFVLKGEGIQFTIGMTGFTSANWGQTASFDLLLPRDVETEKELSDVLGYLVENWSGTLEEISKALDIKKAKVFEALQVACQQGKVMFDLEKYRLRPLTSEPLNLDELQFRNERERVAHDLLQEKGAVKIETENHIYGEGVEVIGNVEVKSEKRDYRPLIKIGEDGRTRKAECTCNFFRKHRLKEGPCSHLIALRLRYTQEKRKRATSNDSSHITVETRTLAKIANHEAIYQVTLNQKRIKTRWGVRGTKLRLQNLVFNSIDEARDAYFQQISDLEAKGFLDITG
ncbi:MAG: hypothetical protein ACI86H_001929 [bacterium]|jgi:hypothetical protein